MAKIIINHAPSVLSKYRLNEIYRVQPDFVKCIVYFYACMSQKAAYTARVNNDAEYKIELDGKNTSVGLINGETFICDVLNPGTQRMHFIRDNKSFEVEVVDFNAEEKTLSVKVNGRDYDVVISDRYDELLRSLGMDKSMGAKVNEMKAPMPGLVLDIRVTEGQSVAKGEPVIVLEAMKMENILKAPADVVVKKVVAKKGNAVEKNQVLVTFE
jgi:acetyl/propionyl-CoA carboxylase alpha subunit